MSNATQVLRTIDKFDKIGPAGVEELLQKPTEEFGANLDPIRAKLLVSFLQSAGADNAATIRNMRASFANISRVNRRLVFMEKLEETVMDAKTGTTGWDRLLAMRPNQDNTWSDGGRPHNIGWALDDLCEALDANDQSPA